MMNSLLRFSTKYLPLIVISLGLSNCALVNKIKKGKESPVKPTAAAVGRNTNYGNASVHRPVPQNPTLGLSSNFSSQGSKNVSHGSRSQKYIALTFDDGPTRAHTPRLLDMLRRRNVKATFYVIGERAANNPSIIRRIIAEGHEIGNHTWSHPNLKKLSDSQIRREFDRTRNAIVAASGVQPRTMRAPYGSISQRQREWIHREYGYPSVMWDVDPLDWKKPGSGVVAQRLISGTRNGSILLVHDLHGSSVDAMPRTIDALLSKGFQFVTVSQLLAQRSVASR